MEYDTLLQKAFIVAQIAFYKSLSVNPFYVASLTANLMLVTCTYKARLLRVKS